MPYRDTASPNEPTHFLTDEEAHELFNARARFHLRISGDEFVERWRQGDFDERRDDPAVVAVAMLLPLVDENARK